MHSHIQSSRHIGLFTHINPDGDALGSTLGLLGYIRETGRECHIFLPGEPGETLEFMIPEDARKHLIIWKKDSLDEIRNLISSCDLLFGMDFNVPDRIGEYAGLFKESNAYKILIDHHVGPARECFDMVFSDPKASSACELTYRLLKQMPDIGGDASKMSLLTRESLMTGMTTDTNNFANSATPETFMMASELLAAGTDRDRILQNLFFCYPQRRIKAQGYLLHRAMRITPDGVAIMVIDRCLQRRYRLKDGDTEGFVNIPLSIKEVKMSILLKREPDSKKVRVSLRSKKGVSARSCAMKYFNGGGHEQASGGRLMIGQDISSMTDLYRYVEKCTHKFFMEQ